MKINNICVLWIAILLAGYSGILLARNGNSAIAEYQHCSSSIPVSTPTNDFIIHDNGTATHLKTGLMWKRCREGTILTDEGLCEDDPDGTARFTLAESFLQTATVNQEGFAGFNDWRVPNIKELGSILELSCSIPINAEVFPLWLGSDLSYASSTNAIGINFGGRDVGLDENHTQATAVAYPDYFYLRLVRDR